MAATKPGIGSRLLIMVYAAALVAIGAYPIQNEYGSVSAFLKRQFAKIAPGEIVPARPLGDLRTKRPMPDGSKASTSRARLTSPKKEKQLDTLSKNDRSELNSLIENLEP